jgi:L-lactate dehydrogenase complex protein LldG
VSARESILGRVRAGLGGVRASSLTAPARAEAAGIPPSERYERFRARLESVGGRVRRVASVAEARAAVAELASTGGARRVFLSDAPLVARVSAGLAPGLAYVGPRSPRAELFEAELGLTAAQWGVAETGTLVLESAEESHRLASLLPPVHVALLPAERLLGTLGEALAAVRAPAGAPSSEAPRSRTITLVTGPSRTADIELTLVVGVHGPRELHVLVLDSPA